VFGLSDRYDIVVPRKPTRKLTMPEGVRSVADTVLTRHHRTRDAELADCPCDRGRQFHVLCLWPSTVWARVASVKSVVPGGWSV